MRSDENLPAEFRDKRQWIVDPATGTSKPEFERLDVYGTEFHRFSYSGYERNKLFLNRRGKAFVDLSGISGADEIADSRSWVKWDFDRDGWQDIGVVNANKPLLSLFRNQLNRSGAAKNRAIALRFVGANHQPHASTSRSARDGYGATVVIETDELKIRREHRCGEGYAAQNSATMLLGVGTAETVRVSVTWPSGAKHGPVAADAGQLVTCFENPQDSPSQAAFLFGDYAR